MKSEEEKCEKKERWATKLPVRENKKTVFTYLHT